MITNELDQESGDRERRIESAAKPFLARVVKAEKNQCGFCMVMAAPVKMTNPIEFGEVVTFQEMAKPIPVAFAGRIAPPDGDIIPVVFAGDKYVCMLQYDCIIKVTTILELECPWVYTFNYGLEMRIAKLNPPDEEGVIPEPTDSEWKPAGSLSLVNPDDVHDFRVKVVHLWPVTRDGSQAGKWRLKYSSLCHDPYIVDIDLNCGDDIDLGYHKLNKNFKLDTCDCGLSVMATSIVSVQNPLNPNGFPYPRPVPFDLATSKGTVRLERTENYVRPGTTIGIPGYYGTFEAEAFGEHHMIGAFMTCGNIYFPNRVSSNFKLIFAFWWCPWVYDNNIPWLWTGPTPPEPSWHCREFSSDAFGWQPSVSNVNGTVFIHDYDFVKRPINISFSLYRSIPTSMDREPFPVELPVANEFTLTQQWDGWPEHGYDPDLPWTYI